ncbi:MAG: malate synthase A, partial [Acidimicrobiia bacterium]|nr:malate synthase A [Acidimicrobiia bacterium]
MSELFELLAPTSPAPEILSTEALGFVAELQREFGSRRAELLRARQERQILYDRDDLPRFQSSGLKSETWSVAPVPAEIEDRRVEITGPVDRKMMINALNSGARVFMADFEDATSPTWENLITGQANLVDAYRRTLHLDTDDKSYRLIDQPATLFVRPRGWHLPEKHLMVGGERVSASLFDFGLYIFHGGRAALEAG